MASLNRVTLIGNLGQDPEMRQTAAQIPVVNFSIATTEVRTDPSGNRTEQTSWHRIIVWNKQAENCQKYLAKGRSVLIEGRIQYREWNDQQGNKRYSTEIVAQRVLFLGNKAENNTGNYTGAYTEPAGNPNYQQPSQSTPSPMNKPFANPNYQQPAQPTPPPMGDPFANPGFQPPTQQPAMTPAAHALDSGFAASSAPPSFPQKDSEAPLTGTKNSPDLDDIPF